MDSTYCFQMPTGPLVLVCSGSQDLMEMLQVILESEEIPSLIKTIEEPQEVDVFVGPVKGIAQVRMPPGKHGETSLFVAPEHAAWVYELMSRARM